MLSLLGTVPVLGLWYAQPASNWNEALPLGNGFLGAMVFGSPAQELLQLNETTFWSGKPHDYVQGEPAKVLPEIRRLLFAGKEQDATQLADKSFMGVPVRQQAFQPLADLVIETPDHAEFSQYRRALDIRRGIWSCDYKAAGLAHHREAFISHPDRVLVYRLTSPKGGKRALTVRLKTPHANTVESTPEGGLVLKGQWIGDGQDRDLQAGVKGEGIRFEVGLRVVPEGGRMVPEKGVVRVEGARAVTVILGASTSFRTYTDIDGPTDGWRDVVDKAFAKGYQKLLSSHTKAMTAIMDRVALDLGKAPDQPTDKRLEAVRNGAQDPDLAALYFQYGRYLLASSSRPGGQPANLQGIWNKDLNPAWGSKWTININTEMNYWPAEVANLSECHEPLFDLLDDLAVTGGKTAKAFYGARGWVAHRNADLWRGAAPVDGVWGVWPMGAAWLARHPWEHFAFNQDRTFLRQRAWPILSGAARFVLDFLVEAPAGTPFAGKLVTNPSHSPENGFVKPDGTVSVFTFGATMDLMIVRDLFENCLAAIAELDQGRGTFEPSLRKELETALARLAPLQISPKDGRLQEWIYDYDEREPGHRHMSHFFGLHPGQSVTAHRSPDLMAAIRKSLDFRLAHGGGGTGWSRAWVVNFMARSADGDGALKNLNLLFARSTLPNLFDNHPPFQIDGNFGGCAGIAEMLLQSHDGALDLLPALPEEWPNGNVRGLKARDGYVVDMEWTGGKLAKATVKSTAGKTLRIRYAGKTIERNTEVGQSLSVDGRLVVRVVKDPG